MAETPRLIVTQRDRSGQVVLVTEFAFATKEEAQRILSVEDQYTRRFSLFDLQSRLKTTGPVTVRDYLEHAAGAVTEFCEGEKRIIATAAATLEARAAELGIIVPMPPRIPFIKTDGREEADASYCRGGAIVLPPGMIQVPVVFHELFHIVSSIDPSLRSKLYEAAGFHNAGHEIPVPPALADRTIANPDALTNSWFIPVTHGGETVFVVPLLISSVASYPGGNKTFFQLMQFFLMRVWRDPMTGMWSSSNSAGFFSLIPPAEGIEYLNSLGGNTDYIIHPEEALAENFSIVISCACAKSTSSLPGVIVAAMKS